MLGDLGFVRSFALYVQDMLKYMTIQYVASILGVGWDRIKNIHKFKLNKMYRTIPAPTLLPWALMNSVSVSDIANMTIFVDLASGRILHAVEGTAKEKLIPFLKKLGHPAFEYPTCQKPF